MRVLVVGGAGYVAGLVLPALTAAHAVRVLDRRPPPRGGFDHVVGDATDHATVRRAAEGTDAVVHCAMGGTDWDSPEGARDAFDVNVLSVHVTLRAAHDAGVPHAVHVSSLSVYRDFDARRLTEDMTPDAVDVYGLTKRLGEEVCRAAVAQWGMSVTILRLAFPTPDDMWPAWGATGEPVRRYTRDGRLIHATAGSDLARAVLAALRYRDGCAAFTITGDRSAGLWSTEKARRLLGWVPTAGG
jgi:nucleoside-diphosphate-sugar epimerase